MRRSHFTSALAFLLAAGFPGPMLASSGDQEIQSLRAQAVEEHLKGPDHDDAALDLFEQAERLAQKQYGADSGYVADLLTEMGIIAADAHKPQTAERYLTEAVKIKPTSLSARVKLSEVLRIRGNQEEASKQAILALQKHQNSVEARQALALAYLDMGQKAKATQAYYYMDQVMKGKKAPLPSMPAPPKPPVQAAVAPPAVKEESKAEKEKPKETKSAKAAPEKSKPAVDNNGDVEVRSDRSERLKALEAFMAKLRAAAAKAKEAKEAAAQKGVVPEAPKPAAKPKPKPVEMHAQPAEMQIKPPKVRGGLVPPPPPVVPMFPGAGGMVPPPPPNYMPGPGQNAVLQTTAKIKKDKPKEAPKEHASSGGGGGAAPDDDFLLDWAADKGAKKKGSN